MHYDEHTGSLSKRTYLTIHLKCTVNIPEVTLLTTTANTNNKGNKHRHLSLYLPSHLTPSPLSPLSSEGMSPLGLAVQQPDPYMASCAAPAADCPSNTSRAALGQEDHACCPFDPASSSCCSTQQHFVPPSPHHTVLRHKNTDSSAEVEGEKGKKYGDNGGGGGGRVKKKLARFFLPTTSTSSDNGSGGFSSQLSGISFLTLHPPFSFKRYDSYCSNQPG